MRGCLNFLAYLKLKSTTQQWFILHRLGSRLALHKEIQCSVSEKGILVRNLIYLVYRSFGNLILLLYLV